MQLPPFTPEALARIAARDPHELIKALKGYRHPRAPGPVVDFKGKHYVFKIRTGKRGRPRFVRAATLREAAVKLGFSHNSAFKLFRGKMPQANGASFVRIEKSPRSIFA